MFTTILDYLENTADRFPEKKSYCDQSISLNYRQTREDAKVVGSYIAQFVEPGNPVVIYMDKNVYNIVAFFGVVYAGCFYVPIDKSMPSERIESILNTLKPSLILCDDDTLQMAQKISGTINVKTYDEAIKGDIDTDALNKIRQRMKSTDLLYVLFTSGSTGVPKGVTISHLAVIDFMEWISNKYSLNENTVLCNQAPFYFDASVPDIYIPLKTGATVYIPPRSYYTFPKKILEYIDSNKINTLIWVPSALCNVVNCHAFDIAVPKTVKLVIFCGEVMPCKHLNVWRKYIPDAHYVNMYGPTEATYACMYYDINRDFSDDETLPLGNACENSTILLLNKEGKLVDKGEIGEICVLGQCLSNGYYNNLSKTSEVFVQNPTNKKWNELMYRTGDLAYISDNNEMIFAGRKDFQIKRLGHRIELGEIENAILSIDGIESACCVFDNKNEDINAIYTGSIGEDIIVNKLVSKIPKYMVPTNYYKVDKMPMNINGKIDRVYLKSIYTTKD